jgi:TATA-binding protein-associated factor Taf7
MTRTEFLRGFGAIHHQIVIYSAKRFRAARLFTRGAKAAEQQVDRLIQRDHQRREIRPERVDQFITRRQRAAARRNNPANARIQLQQTQKLTPNQTTSAQKKNFCHITSF